MFVRIAFRAIRHRWKVCPQVSDSKGKTMIVRNHELRSIPVASIVTDPTQPRKKFDPSKIEALRKSIDVKGILNPLHVRFDPGRYVYLLLLGECRYRAAVEAKLETVPCFVVEGDLDEAEILADRIIENIVRTDLSPIETARALDRLKSISKCNSKELAERFGFNESSLCKKLSLLKLPLEIQTLIETGTIPESSGYELARVENEETRKNLIEAILAGRMTRDALAAEVRKLKGRDPSRPSRDRIQCRFENGLSFTLSRDEPIDFEVLLESLNRMRKVVTEMKRNGDDPGDLAKFVSSH
jgi:ParB family chromosome partitioning protein